MMTSFRDHFPDLPSLLHQSRRRPGTLFPANSVRALSAFFAGIEAAEDFHDIDRSKRFGGFDINEFERWVEAKHNPNQLTARSFTLAELNAGSDAAGIHVWFDWYDEFTRLSASTRSSQ